MFDISLSEEFKEHCPNFKGVAVEAWAVNTPYSATLWEEIDAYSKELIENHNIDEIKLWPSIAATREAYRSCGKDPSRYRPSGEALCRRVLRGLKLYQIDTLVDIINLVSMKSGYSIGGFDADKIQGQKLVLGIGREGEPYEGIGRGMLNIEGLPVYRDSIGGVGTPTSDNERTKMDLGTTHILAIINGYSGEEGLKEAADFTVELLRKHASSTHEEIYYFK